MWSTRCWSPMTGRCATARCWPAPPGGRPGDVRRPAPRSPTSPMTCASPPAGPLRPQIADLPGCGRGPGGGLRHTRRMRVYLPVTLTELTDPEGLSGREARALTRSLRAALGPDADSETGEYAADRKSTRLNSSHVAISYAVFCLK